MKKAVQGAVSSAKKKGAVKKKINDAAKKNQVTPATK
jgi:hypothetical protein